MIELPITDDQRAQLIGWVNREKDHLLSIVAMGERIITTKVTGSLDASRTDLHFLTNLRSAAYAQGGLRLTPEDVELLSDIAGANKFPNRERFWREIQDVIQRATQEPGQGKLFEDAEP